MDGFERGRGHAGLAGQRHRLAGKPGQFEARAPDEVGRHRGNAVIAETGGKPGRLLARILVERHAARPAYGGDLGRADADQRFGFGAAPDHAVIAAHDGVDGAHGHQEDEFLPYIELDIRARHGLDVRRPACRRQRLDARRGLSAPFAEDQAVEGRVLLDGAGFADEGVDEGRAADNPVQAENGAEPLAGVDAVLERHDRSLRADQRAGRFAGAFEVPLLDRDEHDFRRTDSLRPVGREGRADMQVPGPAIDLEAAAPDRLQMRPARDQPDFVARRRQARPEDPADPARANNGDLHASAAAARWMRRQASSSVASSVA